MSIDEYKDIHNKVSKAANKIFSQLQFKEAFKVNMSKINMSDFKENKSIDFMRFDVYPISKKYKIEPRDFGTSDNNRELNKNFNNEFKNISKLMKSELKSLGIKVKDVDYSGDWDSGNFTIYFK